MSLTADGAFTFPAGVADGTPYAISVVSQPSSPSQTCVVVNANGTVRGGDALGASVTCTTNRYELAGSVVGLLGSGLVVKSGAQTATPARDGPFSLGTVESGADYTVTVTAQPTGPWQTCVVQPAAGTMGASPVPVTVQCSTNRFSVGVTVSGLAGTGLILQESAGESVAVNGDGTYFFPTTIGSGTSYAVTAIAAPANPAQTCVLTNADGVIQNANVDVGVSCTTNQYHIGGAVSGLAGSGLVLRLNGQHDVALSGDGNFAFGQSLPSGSAFTVAVAAQPTGPPQTCLPSLGSGTIVNADVHVDVTCTTDSFIIRGTVSGLVGSGFVLASQPGGFVAIDESGDFEFPAPVLHGTSYSIEINTWPSAPKQSCQVNDATGVVVADVTVTVECKTDNYLYALARDANTVLGYTLNSYNGQPFPVGSGGQFATGTTPVALGIDPSGRFLYVVNYGSEDLSGFRVDPLSGELEAVPGSPYPLGDRPTAIAIDATGSFVYVANFGDDSVSVFAIDGASGALAPVIGSPFSVSTAPASLAAHPQQQRLYVVTQGDQLIRHYIIEATGALSPTAGSYDPGPFVPYSMVFNASGTRLYTGSFESWLRVHDLQPDGSLVSAAYPARHAAAGIALHPRAPFAFVPALTFAPGVNLSVYALDAVTGAPTEIAGSPYGSANNPSSVAVHPEGTFVYVSDQLSTGIYGHAIDVPTGTLTPIVGSPFGIGSVLGEIAIRKDDP